MATKTQTTQANAVVQIAANLNQVVAESYGLLAQLHLAHWNVEGPHFLPYHQMFQEQYEELFEAIDEIAERIRAIGHYAEGGLKRLASMSTVEEGPTAAKCSDKDFLASLVVAHETVIGSCLEGRKLAGEAGDAETEDLLIGRIKVHQKAVWFLKSSLK